MTRFRLETLPAPHILDSISSCYKLLRSMPYFFVPHFSGFGAGENSSQCAGGIPNPAAECPRYGGTVYPDSPREGTHMHTLYCGFEIYRSSEIVKRAPRQDCCLTVQVSVHKFSLQWPAGASRFVSHVAKRGGWHRLAAVLSS